MSSDSTKKILSDRDGEPLFFKYSYVFLHRFLHESGHSEHTAASYKTALNSFLDFIELSGFTSENFTFAMVTRDFMLDWIRYLKGKNKDGTKDNSRKALTNSSINARLAAIKSYAAYAISCDASLSLVCGPIKHTAMLKTVDEAKKILSPQQIELIVDQAPRTGRGWRDQTMLLLLYETGCRVSELVNLRVDDVSTEPGHEHVNVFGKGKKQRIIPISQPMAQTIEKFKDHFHRGELLNVCEYLFYTVIKGRVDKITPRSVQLILAKYAEKARQTDGSIPERVHPHMLRRSRATTLYRKGLPFEMVSGLLGHERLETTKVYAKPDPEFMRNKMSRALSGTIDDESTWVENKEFKRKVLGLA